MSIETLILFTGHTGNRTPKRLLKICSRTTQRGSIAVKTVNRPGFLRIPRIHQFS